MVASFTDPVTDADLQTWRLEVRAKANQGRKGTVPPPGAEKEDYFPPAIRLPTARAIQRALRYYVNRFPTLNTFQAVINTETGRTTGTWVRTALSGNEEEAFQDLKLMDKSTF
jgi:DNA invertase Pin-like site-specific DNA recombinase